jgi:hypothetical protein
MRNDQLKKTNQQEISAMNIDLLLHSDVYQYAAKTIPNRRNSRSTSRDELDQLLVSNDRAIRTMASHDKNIGQFEPSASRRHANFDNGLLVSAGIGLSWFLFFFWLAICAVVWINGPIGLETITTLSRSTFLEISFVVLSVVAIGIAIPFLKIVFDLKTSHWKAIGAVIVVLGLFFELAFAGCQLKIACLSFLE